MPRSRRGRPPREDAAHVLCGRPRRPLEIAEVMKIVSALTAVRPLGPRRSLVVVAVSLPVVAVALFVWWPLGVVLGLAAGVLVVLALGEHQVRAARAVPEDDDLLVAAGLVPPPAPALTRRPAPRALPAVRVREALPAAPAHGPQVAAPAEEQGVRADLVRLKAELGDDYPDFARAARLVVSTQYASAARLQRDLQLPYSRARRLLAGLESEHFVGPATGTLPRQVLMPKERLPEVERLFAGV